MKTFIKKPKLVFIFIFLLMLSPLAEKNLRERILDFLMLETISGIDNIMTPQESLVLGKKSPVTGVNTVQGRTNINRIANEKLGTWIRKSQTRALIIQKDNEIVFEHYDENSGSGETINGLSMTKTVTALLIGIAVEEKHISSIDDSVRIYLPEIKLKEGDQVSIRDMLKQISGMHDPFMPLLDTMKGNDITEKLDELVFLEDKKFKYSNINYYLLALVLERAYEKQLSEIISEKLWLPMALEHAEVIDSTGYCCIYASARSWLAIGELIAQNGLYQNQQIVPENWVKQMKQDTTEPEHFFMQLSTKSRNNFYGYHIFSGLESHPTAYWSEGMGLQVIFILPEENLIIIRLGDIPSVFNGNNNRWDSNLFNGLLEVVDEL